jgi:beta-glucanase (GH16 family)
MKIVTSTLFMCLVLSAFSCKKEDTTAGGGGTTPTGPDVAINYQAQAVCNADFNDATLLNAGWAKAFEDNFDNSLSNWNNWTSGAYSGELQYYQAANLQITSGALAIAARKEDATGAATPEDKTSKTFKYTSGRIESKNSFSANATTPKVRIIARIKQPKGYGMYPSFVSYGNNWPTQGQIDFALANGQSPTQYLTNYYYSSKAGTNDVRGGIGNITTNADLTECYHVYETEWTKDALAYYLDGKLVETKTGGGLVPNLFGKSHRLSFYLAVNSTFLTRGQISTGTMYVDWVKVFTSK